MVVRRTLVKQQPVARATKPAVSSSREVFVSGVPFGTKHLVDLRGSVQDEQTRCGCRPGLKALGDAYQCPVCFNPEPGRNSAIRYCHPCRRYHRPDAGHVQPG